MKKQIKPKIRTTIESHNAREEVRELIQGSLKSGFSKALDPVYKVIKEETISPRGQLLNMEKGIYSDILYKASLCMGAEQGSLSKVPFSRIIRKARKVLVEEGRASQTEDVKKIVEEIKEYLKEESQKSLTGI